MSDEQSRSRNGALNGYTRIEVHAGPDEKGRYSHRMYEVMKTWANWDGEKFESVGVNFATREGAEKFAEMRREQEKRYVFSAAAYFVREQEHPL